MNKKNIIVIGAGIAGIAAAVKCAENGARVNVVESRAIPGGRSYSLADKTTGEIIDNGQHVLVGAYKNFLEIVDKLGNDEYLYKQKPLKVKFIEAGGQSYLLDTSKFPGKAGTLYGLMNFKGFSFHSKMNLLRFFININSKKVKPEGLNAADFLHRNRQGKDVIERFWEPLIIATLNSRPENAAATLLVEVLKRAFFAEPKDSRIFFPNKGLSALVDGFKEWMEERGGNVIYEDPVKDMIFENRRFAGVKLKSGRKIYGDACISAIPFEALSKMLPKDIFNKNFSKFTEIEHSTIISVYLWFDRDFLEDEFCALIGTNVQWVFNKRKLQNSSADIVEKYPGHLALTISAADKLNDLNSQEILDLCLDDLRKTIPAIENAKLLHHRVIRNRRATILASPEVNALRPPVDTSVDNLYIAGDWTDTGLPATIEGAAQSGSEAAEEACLWNNTD